MENKTLQPINYYDFKLSLPFFIVEEEITKIKIPARSISEAFNYLESLLFLSVDFVTEIQIYEVSKIQGNTRIDFKKIQSVKGTMLKSWVTLHKRNNKKIVKK